MTLPASARCARPCRALWTPYSFNADLYQTLKDSFRSKGDGHGHNAPAMESAADSKGCSVGDGVGGDREMKTEEDDECNFDAMFFAKLENLKRIIVALFERYGLKYTASKSVEFAIAECGDEYLSISAARTLKQRELERYKKNKEEASGAQQSAFERQSRSEREAHRNELKQIKLRYEAALKKSTERVREETKEELERAFDETARSRARRAMTQIRDGQQKTIKALQKKITTLQSEVQRLQSDNKLIETKKELQREHFKAQLADLRQRHSEEKREFDSIAQRRQNELDSLRAQHRDIAVEHRGRSEKDQSTITRLRQELQSKNEEFDALKAQLREQIKALTVNMNAVEKEHESKMLRKQNEHELLIQECQQRMQAVLEKKNGQNMRLKRLLEKTVAEYEKEKQLTQTMLNLRDQQLQEITDDLQL